MSDTLVAKKLITESDFDRDAILERLFALPVPPIPSNRRSYPIHTPLGRIMRVRGRMIRDVSAMEGCPNERMMSDYLAGRRELAPHHRGALARGLGVDARLL